MAVAQPSEEASSSGLTGLPITELPWDTVLSALTFLGAADLSTSSRASRLLFILVREAQRRPSIVTEVGPPSNVFAALGQQLSATPTLGFLFATGDLEDPVMSRILCKYLPPSCHLIGAQTGELQALVRPAHVAQDVNAIAVAGSTALRNVRDDGHVSVMLGSFPDASASSFFFDGGLARDLLACKGDAAALDVLKKHNVPCGDDWKTIVLLVSQRTQADPQMILDVFQRLSPNTAIIGGIAGEDVLLHSRGHTRIHSSGVVGLALKGSVPLTGLVSRGSKPLTPSMRVSSASIKGGTLSIPKLIVGDGAEVIPIEVVIGAQRKSTSTMPLFVGVRYRAGVGYKLENLSQDMFDQGGSLNVKLSHQHAHQSLSECEVRFYQLDAEECKADLKSLLGYVRQQALDEEDKVLGGVMFTCGGRSARFFNENSVDMKQFKDVFPTLPLIGFWAGGEIGPQAFAESSPSEATRTGNAAFQGFTAVFGIFRAPKSSSSRLQVMSMGDEQLPQATGDVFGGLAHEAKERGNSAFKEGCFREASEHYSRASALAGVPSAGLSSSEQAIILSNRAMARLKAEDFEAALEDADAAIAFDPQNVKAHHRRGQALLGMKRPEDAAAGLEAACDDLGSQQDGKEKLASLEQLLKQARAIVERKRKRKEQTDKNSADS